MDFLGHHVDEHGIRPLSDKVKIIRDFLVLRQSDNFVDFWDW